MTAKFNFLDRRSGLEKIAADLRKQFPKKPDSWIKTQAKVLATDVSTELRAPGKTYSIQRGRA